MWITEPTNHPAKCFDCCKKLNGKLPKLSIPRRYGGRTIGTCYLCLNCAVTKHRPGKELIKEYKELLTTKYRDVATVEEL